MLFACDTDNLKGFMILTSTGWVEVFTSQYLLPNFEDKKLVQVIEQGRYTLVNYRYKVMAGDVSAGDVAQSSKVLHDQSIYYIARNGRRSW
jgi:hypothetical protein